MRFNNDVPAVSVHCQIMFCKWKLNEINMKPLKKFALIGKGTLSNRTKAKCNDEVIAICVHMPSMASKLNEI